LGGDGKGNYLIAKILLKYETTILRDIVGNVVVVVLGSGYKWRFFCEGLQCGIHSAYERHFSS